MSSKTDSHEQSREKVCGVCFRKPKQYQKISPLVLHLIKKHSYKDYSLQDTYLPVICCMSCVCALKVIESGKDGRNLPDIDYTDLKKPQAVNTRSAVSEKCCCSICAVARLNGHEYKEYEKTRRAKPGRPREKEKGTSVTVQHCSDCHSEIGPGKPHECTRTVTQENLVELIRNHSEKTQEQVTSKILDAICQEKGVSKEGGSTMLATKGLPKLVTIGKSRTSRPNPKYTIEDLTKLQVSRNLSDNDTLAVASFLRTKGGKNSVETNLKQGLRERNHELDSMFYKKDMTMKEKPKKKKKKKKDCDCDTCDSDSEELEDMEDLVDGMRDIQRPGIFVKDLDEFTAFVVNARGLDPKEHIIQFGFDDGQGMLKVMEIVKKAEPEEQMDKKRSKYSDGVCPKSTKLSSVKKMFVVGLVPQVQELYPNVKAMLDELKLDGIEYGLCADIKIYLTLIGKQAASCLHPCPYCEGKAPWDKNYKALTIGSLKDWNKKFVESGGNKKKAKDYQNVVNPPLLTGDDSTKTLEVLNISELHCMTGTVGKLISEKERCAFVEKEDGEKFMNDFLKREDISKCVYQGSNSFEGNQARKLLQSVDKLERDVQNLMDFETAAKALPFVETLRLFDKVVTACFGQTLDPAYEEHISNFSKQYRTLGITVTPKVHIIERHVAEFLKLKGEVAGLGFWSEQSMESGHHDYKLEWEKVKVSPNHEEYGDRLLDTTVRYAGKHL